MGLFKTRDREIAQEVPAQESATPQDQAPRKKAKLKNATPEPVTPEKFAALQSEFEAFKKIAALAIAALELALKASPGMPDANPRSRLEKLAAVCGLDARESTALRALVKLLDQAGKAESKRQFAESAQRTRPMTFEDFRPPNWRG
jgi:hypothetical protein